MVDLPFEWKLWRHRFKISRLKPFLNTHMHTHPWSWTTDQWYNADSRGKQIIIHTKSACARETMWNLFMRNITKCSTGKPRTPQLKSTDTIWKFQVRVCLFCYVGGCMQYRGVAFVSVSLGLLHSNTPPLTTTTPPAPHFFQTNVHKQHKTNHQRGWKKTHAAVLALMLPGNQTKVIL